MIDIREPYKSASKQEKSGLKYKLPDLRKEVMRRGVSVAGMKSPMPTYWNKKKVMEYLMDHPVIDPPCVDFLRRREAQLATDLRVGAEERRRESSNSAASARVCWDIWDFIRLFELLARDDVKEKYLQ